MYCLRARHREQLRAHLTEQGVGTHVYYPSPLPRQPAFATDGSWPQAERACREILALPIYPHLTDAQVEHIAEAVCAFAGTPAGAGTR